LLALAILSFVTKDYSATVMIGIMVVMSFTLRFVQELKANKAAQKLRAFVRTTAKVLRQGVVVDLPLHELVPGDIIHLSAGDMIPADILLLTSRDLFVNQATLTGESLPTEKHSEVIKEYNNLLELQNICFLGTNVESGTAMGLVIATGKETYLGGLADDLTQEKEPTGFDLGIKSFTWLIIRFVMIMVPAVFLINGFIHGNWVEAFFFALAVAIGLTPELLPMIVTVNLSKGAMVMSKNKVIVKRLNAIQNFGAMNILCTDKTGTLTEGRVVLEKHLDIYGNDCAEVLQLAYLNSYFQTGLTNLLDTAVLNHHEVDLKDDTEKQYTKIDELPFDFVRRRMSVVVEGPQKEHIFICKGAIEEVITHCTMAKLGDRMMTMAELEAEKKGTIPMNLNQDGFRVVAVAYKKIIQNKERYTVDDENDLILLGYLAFLDPPKATADDAIKSLEKYGVQIKVLTGDNELVTGKICTEVGLRADRIVLGEELDDLTGTELIELVREVNIFAKLTPAHKEKIVTALRKSGNVVGFLGDGINDAAALKAADVGISVDSAADIAKESSDIILLERNLEVLQYGVVQGRRTFGNIVKYMQMAASSNFGNMLSVVGGSIFLPFLPMLPLQILANNLLYDLSQTAIPSDHVDNDYVLKPRQWDISRIKKFILLIGPVSSMFDFFTYFMMLYIFNAWFNPALFHTGWFVESLISETLIIYIIRTDKIPFVQSWPSWPLLITTLAICGVSIYLPFSPLAATLGFVNLPPVYWLFLFIIVIMYFVFTQLIKRWFNRRYQIE
jgi:Mg2+-importing ATPase